MKSLSTFFTILLLTITANVVTAETYTFEVPMPSSSPTPVYPGLDLSDLNKISLIVEKSIENPEPTIKRITFDFPKASNITLYNLSSQSNQYGHSDSGVYKGILKNAWVFREVAVEVRMPTPLQSGSPVEVKLNVVERNNYLNHPEDYLGPELLNANGPLVDKSANKLADRASIVLDEKRLNLNLLQRASTDDFGKSGFVIKTNWLGKGERTIYVDTPFGHDAFHHFNAVELILEEIPLHDGMVEYDLQIRYEDKFSNSSQTTNIQPLRILLEEAYRTPY
ncbi:hypothetical protein [Pleionea sediminis]|uniref:hypothetical protein n=1 Tax=Pleionea sediminis TaxID=2569479 RepID=UPI001184B3E5|nr:hypothetical protein [Pleionea sediminis]